MPIIFFFCRCNLDKCLVYLQRRYIIFEREMDSARGTPLMTTGNYPEMNDVSYASNPPQNYERYPPNTYQNQNYGNQPYQIQGYPQGNSNQYPNQGYQQNQNYPIQPYPQNQGFQPQGPMAPPPPQMQPNVVINFPAQITAAHRNFDVIKPAMH